METNVSQGYGTCGRWGSTTCHIQRIVKRTGRSSDIAYCGVYVNAYHDAPRPDQKVCKKCVAVQKRESVAIPVVVVTYRDATTHERQSITGMVQSQDDQRITICPSDGAGRFGVGIVIFKEDIDES